MTIETVIFDLGNVLVWVDHRPLVAGLARICGREERAVQRTLERNSGVFEAYERGKLDARQFYDWVLETLGIAPKRYSFARHRQLWCSVLRPWPEAEALFHRVCAATPTCVLSNTNDLHWGWTAAERDLLPHARATFTSYESGLFKPEPAIYREALRHFGVADPARALFMDDRPENVDAARDAGMTASFVFTTPVKARPRLEALLGMSLA